MSIFAHKSKNDNYNSLEDAPDAFEAQFGRIWKYNDCEVAFARAKWRYRLVSALSRSAETTLYLMVALALLQMAATRLLKRKLSLWAGAGVTPEEASLEAAVLEEAEAALRRGRVGRRARQQLIWWIEMQRVNDLDCLYLGLINYFYLLDLPPSASVGHCHLLRDS